MYHYSNMFANQFHSNLENDWQSNPKLSTLLSNLFIKLLHVLVSDSRVDVKKYLHQHIQVLQKARLHDQNQDE